MSETDLYPRIYVYYICKDILYTGSRYTVEVIEHCDVLSWYTVSDNTHSLWMIYAIREAGF